MRLNGLVITRKWHKMTVLNGLLLAFFCLFTACRDKKIPLTTGEYSHGLHLNTREDGTFYAWFSADSISDFKHFVLLGMPYAPLGNVAFWLPPNDKKANFGIIERLGKDSFRLQSDTLLDASAQAAALQKGVTFVLKRARPDWVHFYFFLPTDTAFLYKKPSLRSEKMVVSMQSPLYSDSLVGDWVRLQTDSGRFWLPRNVVF